MFDTTEEEMTRAAVGAGMTDNLHSRWDGEGENDDDNYIV